MNDPAPLEALLAKGTDNALLRFGLGQAWLRQGQPEKAIPHLQRALEHQANYTAAWKLLGKAWVEAGDHQAAIDAFEQGVRWAGENGDQQAEKEMRVFLKRLKK